jgi:DNA-nicking Smr family endonuclease
MTQDDDKSIFRQMMQGVKPLKQNKLKIERVHTPITPQKRSRPLPNSLKPPPALSDPYEQTITAETTLSYGQDKLPSKRYKQLKHGEIPKQSRLDLHGLQVSAARDSLVQFISQSHMAGFRCVLIIHGKGGLQNDVSILKSHVNHWLKQFEEVLAFHSALPKDGGRGAVYVLLKSNQLSF